VDTSHRPAKHSRLDGPGVAALAVRGESLASSLEIVPNAFHRTDARIWGSLAADISDGRKRDTR
jgi:hypothetical protein